jgi:mannose-6-phosphate isomerase
MDVAALSLGSKPMSRVWGGNRMTSRLGLSALEPIGELWLAYDENPVKNGTFAGIKLSEVLNILGPDFIGRVPQARYGMQLPLLVKFIDTAEWLSVQVHPNDAYAHAVEAESGFHGKTEAWYVLEVEGQGEIVYGWEQTTDEDTYRRSALDGSIWERMHRERVRPEQVAFVPAGTIHALGPGLLLYEVQQRSDLTYRIYDYGRPRELHLDKAIDVSRLEPTPMPDPAPQTCGNKQVLLASRAFVLEKYVLDGKTSLSAPEESFLLLTLVRGDAFWNDGPMDWGDTLLVGAGKTVHLDGHAVLLGSFIPSEERLAKYPEETRV